MNDSLMCPSCKKRFLIAELSIFQCETCNKSLVKIPEERSYMKNSTGKVSKNKAPVVQSNVQGNTAPVRQDVAVNVNNTENHYTSENDGIEYKFRLISQANAFSIAKTSLVWTTLGSVLLGIVNFFDKFTIILERLGMIDPAIYTIQNILSNVPSLKLYISFVVIVFLLIIVFEKNRGPQDLSSFLRGKYTLHGKDKVFVRFKKQSQKGELVSPCPKCSGTIKVKDIRCLYKGVRAAGICSENPEYHTFTIDFNRLNGHFQKFTRVEKKVNSQPTTSSR